MQAIKRKLTVALLHPMYEDQDLWPIKCLGCTNEFTAKIGWLKSDGSSVCCPNRYLLHQYNHREFLIALAEARNGEFDPFRDMLHVRRPIEKP